MIVEYLAALVAFLGLPVGLFLNLVAKEEIKPGKKYFNLLQIASSLLIITMVLCFFGNYDIVYIPLFIFGFVLGYFLRQPYLYLGFTVFSSFATSKNLFLLTSCLTFIYGLPYGTLLKEKKDWLKKTFLTLPLFFLPLAANFVMMDPKIFLAFGIGGILASLFPLFKKASSQQNL